MRLTPLGGAEEPGFAGQQQHFKEVGGISGTADDVILNSLGALVFQHSGGGAEGLDSFAGGWCVIEVRGDHRAGHGELIGQKGEFFLGAQPLVIGLDARIGEDFGNGGAMPVGMLADVECEQVQTEHLDLADEGVEHAGSGFGVVGHQHGADGD